MKWGSCQHVQGGWRPQGARPSRKHNCYPSSQTATLAVSRTSCMQMHTGKRPGLQKVSQDSNKNVGVLCRDYLDNCFHFHWPCRQNLWMLYGPFLYLLLMTSVVTRLHWSLESPKSFFQNSNRPQPLLQILWSSGGIAKPCWSLTYTHHRLCTRTVGIIPRLYCWWQNNKKKAVWVQYKGVCVCVHVCVSSCVWRYNVHVYT